MRTDYLNFGLLNILREYLMPEHRAEKTCLAPWWYVCHRFSGEAS